MPTEEQHKQYCRHPRYDLVALVLIFLVVALAFMWFFVAPRILESSISYTFEPWQGQMEPGEFNYLVQGTFIGYGTFGDSTQEDYAFITTDYGNLSIELNQLSGAFGYKRCSHVPGDRVQYAVFKKTTGLRWCRYECDKELYFDVDTFFLKREIC